tara:strand:+ start:115 stop:291 length:177 start_codon:yes stop_codon:yes gene_type:complete
MDTFDTILFMLIGMGLMIGGLLGMIMPTEFEQPWVLIVVSAVGLITFWLPVIITSLED